MLRVKGQENAQALGSVQSVLIPTGVMSLVVPSTMVAEVAGLGELTPAGAAAPCVLGVFAWRGLRVPVLSFEALCGRPKAAPGRRSKIVIFYPLPGRDREDFFAMLSSADPRSRLIGPGQVRTDGVQAPDNPYIAEAFELDGTVVGIPDMKAVRAAF